MAGLGVLHFVIGRYCNFRANQVAGVNLTAPVVQLQVVVTMVLAVVVLHEPCTALQMIGGVVILAGSLDHAAPAAGTIAAPAAAEPTPAQAKPALPLFIPRYLAGYVFASLAAIAYGTTPIMARFALEHTGPATGILGGLIAYVAATAVVALGACFRAAPAQCQRARTATTPAGSPCPACSSRRRRASSSAPSRSRRSCW